MNPEIFPTTLSNVCDFATSILDPMLECRTISPLISSSPT